MVSEKIINCEFEFKCPLHWNDLRPLEDGSVKFCESCQKNVHFARTQDEVNELAAEGKCVAFDVDKKRIFRTGQSIEIYPDLPPMMGMIVPNQPEEISEQRQKRSGNIFFGLLIFGFISVIAASTILAIFWFRSL